MVDLTGSLDAGGFSVFEVAFESLAAVVSADFLFSPQATIKIADVQKNKNCFLSMQDNDLELYVSVRGFNDVYSNTVQQRTSYTYHEIKVNEKFIPMYYESENGTILELQKLSKFVVPKAETN